MYASVPDNTNCVIKHSVRYQHKLVDQHSSRHGKQRIKVLQTWSDSRTNPEVVSQQAALSDVLAQAKTGNFGDQVILVFELDLVRPYILMSHLPLCGLLIISCNLSCLACQSRTWQVVNTT